jgi:HAMP domain-containing protein
MKFRFNIAKKLIFGFGVVTLAILVNILLINKTLNKSIDDNNKIASIYVPSADLIQEFSDKIVSSKMLIKNWVYIEKQAGTQDKLKLIKLLNTDIPEIHDKILKLSNDWDDSQDKDFYEEIYVAIQDTLTLLHQDVMNKLSTLESYDDFFLLMTDVYTKVEEGGEIMLLSNSILEKLNTLIIKHNAQVEESRIDMADSFNNLENFIYASGVILVIIAIIIALYLAQMIIKPIISIKDILMQMGKGIMPKKQIKERNDEIGEMAGALNSLIRGLKETTDFALEIGKGNFESPFVPLSADDDLGNTLLEMRTNLKHATIEAAKRKEEDDQRNWASQGVAKFSDILRQNNDNMEKLSYDIISNLVKYCDANQGGLFLINDDDQDNPFIEMSSAYAFNRKKVLEKRIEMGTGLIGRAIQESETIYMTDIPNDYINITSGLGDDNPKSLLIVPLIVNQTVYGVIELASFKAIPKYQVDFIQKIGENIASTLSTVKINIRTAQLLETTKQQAEEMGAQEEEMRQNMEELQATQEESSRREAELEKKVAEFEKFKKQQQSFIKKLDGNLSGGLVSTIDDDDDDDDDEN